MDRAQIDEYLAERRNGVLGTVSKKGAPLLVPVFFYWQDGHAYVSATKERGFFQNLAANPQISLCIDDAGPPQRTVILRGAVKVIEGEEHWQITDQIIRKYVPEEMVETRLEFMHTEPRVILDIEPKTIASWTPTSGDREIWQAD